MRTFCVKSRFLDERISSSFDDYDGPLKVGKHFRTRRMCCMSRSFMTFKSNLTDAESEIKGLAFALCTGFVPSQH